MLIPRIVVWMFSVGVMALVSAGAVSGQDYPHKVIRIVTAGAGGGADFLTRLVAQGIAGPLRQQVVTENRGGSPVIPLQVVSKASPDGYTLLMYSDSMWILPFLQNVPYDPLKDFAPITSGASGPNILVVHPSLPVKSVKDLVALAKARPGVLNFSRAAAGASTQMAPELFKALAGIDIRDIRYKGAAPALNALLAGEVDFAFPAAASMIPYLKSDKLRALAVTSLQRSALAPGLPTMAESGFPGFESGVVYAFFAPAGTPAVIINRLNHEMAQVLNRSDMKEKLYRIGLESAASTPEQLAAAMKAQMAKWGKLIKDANLRPAPE